MRIKEIQDIIIVGEIRDEKERVVGFHGQVITSESLLNELEAYPDWEKEQIFGNKPCLLFQIDKKGQVEIRMCVASYSTAPLRNYAEPEFVDAITVEVQKLFNSK